MFLFQSHKQTVTRLRRMREHNSAERSGRCLLTRARSLARWAAAVQRIEERAHWFPDRFACEVYAVATV